MSDVARRIRLFQQQNPNSPLDLITAMGLLEAAAKALEQQNGIVKRANWAANHYSQRLSDRDAHKHDAAHFIMTGENYVESENT